MLFVTHDIDEAIYLGQRVLVLSNRPTVIMADVAVDLPDEREQLGTRNLPQFAELRTHVHELVQKAKRGDRPDTPDDRPALSRPVAPGGAGRGESVGVGSAGHGVRCARCTGFRISFL